MDIVAWRIVQDIFAPPHADPMNGVGALKVGGRWNSIGIPVVYFSWSVSLAVLETLVHAEKFSSLTDRVIASVSFRATDIFDAIDETDDLKSIEESRKYGDRWAAELKTPVLRVPSVVIPSEFNFVLNVLHPEYPRIRATVKEWKPLPIDRRLLGLK